MQNDSVDSVTAINQCDQGFNFGLGSFLSSLDCFLGAMQKFFFNHVTGVYTAREGGLYTKRI